MQRVEGREPEGNWPVGDPEAPQDDAAEQHRSVVEPGIDPEAAVGTTPRHHEIAALDVADEGDLAEQAREVPDDEEEDGWR